METMGFKLREKFHAGAEAGWGAQVIEHPESGITCFCDVDLSAEESKIDIARVGLKDNAKLGTVGLWCALHGESFFSAGLHHLAARFEFTKFESDLKAAGLAQMAAFSEFPYLKQAFSIGERWTPDADRLAQLIKNKSVTEVQARRFHDEGALGSHLENIQRNQGFKGFNRQAVSDIISATDPRRQD
jgi:hypothetical protein